jgi:Mn2+/Fe2+ NRAMP family transporter
MLIFSIALDEQGANICNWMNYSVIATGAVLGSLTFFLWFQSYKNKLHMTIAMLSFALAFFALFLFYQTQEKINKEYFLSAINPDAHEHQFEYYFRNDSTLKTHGLLSGTKEIIFKHSACMAIPYFWILFCRPQAYNPESI